MSRYVDGFVLPVPKKNLARYRRVARVAGKVWREHGALEYVECVADQLTSKHDGETFTSLFPKLARVKPGEVVVFAWITYKSKADQKRIMKKVMEDPRLSKMMDPANMPFDMRRMAWAGFKPIVEAQWVNFDRQPPEERAALLTYLKTLCRMVDDSEGEARKILLAQLSLNRESPE